MKQVCPKMLTLDEFWLGNGKYLDVFLCLKMFTIANFLTSGVED